MLPFLSWIVIPFTIFWSLYFTIGLTLYWARLKNFSWYRRLFLNHRKDTVTVKLDFAHHFNVLGKNVISTFLGSIIFFAIFGYPVTVETNSSNSVIEYVLKPVLVFFIADTWFYHMHYAFHYFPGMMKRFHSLHHVYVAPYAINGLWCHPVEMIFVNLPMLLVGPRLVHIQLLPFLVLVALGCISTLLSHDGTDWYFMSATYHESHHRHVKGNFGISPFWDTVYGTRII
jgi:sterol desaturase/sphingolipid hydroxylase (fatty acid hydroxylase superfamily)